VLRIVIRLPHGPRRMNHRWTWEDVEARLIAEEPTLRVSLN
jgi:hypothetical protein